MMKRAGKFDNSSGKKVKLDDLWGGEDLDSEAVEDCFRLATQVCQEDKITCTQLNNVTLLPTYSGFKPQSSFCQSTQLETTMKFSLLDNNNGSQINSESKMRLLQQKCAEKEGEVAILRANLKDLRTNSSAELHRKETEWSEKFNVIMKETRSITSELHFKNLEIANLKQRLAELSRCFAQNQTQKGSQVEAGPSTFKSNSPQKNVPSKTPKICRTRITPEVHPLQQVDFSAIFKISKSPKTSLLVEEEEFLLTTIYPDILHLISCDVIQLESDQAVAEIDKILRVSIDFLNKFRATLKESESGMRLEELQHLDSHYLDLNNKSQVIDLNSILNEECEKEIGQKCGKVLIFLAELLQHSEYFQNYIFPRSASTFFVDLIYEIITIIGRTRLAYKCSGFLSATLQFLTNTFRLKSNDDERVNYLTKIVKEFIFVRPTYNVVLLLPSLLKISSLQTHFVSNLCTEVNIACRKKQTQRGVMYHDKDSCVFQVFVSLFESVLSKIEIIPLETNKSLLSFIGNIFKSNVWWLYYKEGTQCACLFQLYALTVKLVQKNLQAFKSRKFETECPKSLIKMSVKIFNLLTFNSYSCTEERLRVFAQYRDVVNYLLTCKEEFGLNIADDLDTLDTTEEMPTILCSNFDKINF